MSEDSLFPELGSKPKPEPLKDPVEITLRISRDNPAEIAVLVSNHMCPRAWVPRKLIRFDGLGEQRVQIERWKAKELGLI